MIFMNLFNLNVQYVFDSEDCTGIVKRIKYDSTTNTFTGFPSLLGRGVPVKSYYQTDSFDALKLWLNSIDKASLLNVHMIQPVQSTDNSSISSPYLLSAYGIDNTATANDILQRWWYIFNQSLQRNIRTIGFSTGPTHLITKWRNRLSSATAELCLGNQPISINHLHDIIENDTYSKLDHGLTKSDINPKDRQNFSSCLKLTSNDLFNILNATVDTRGTLLYFQVLKMIIVAYIEKTTTIVESENTRALSGIYSAIVNFTAHNFLRRAQRLSLLNDIKCKQLHNGSVEKYIELIGKKHVLELKTLSEYLFRQLNFNSQKHNYSSQISNIDDEVFESDDDNDEDGDDTTNDFNMNEDNDDSSINNDYTDEDEQNNTQDLINTTKKDFSGVKVADKVEPHIEHTYFKVK
ncbi:unnamed protein product [Rotaria socialis]|uniref:Uncharacterized protein n=1 Tax=Rotaria socialis TaxID=392032 RepID=A0A820VDA8_9BILA|nr:unnamed protein product [Rotaria socialis]